MSDTPIFDQLLAEQVFMAEGGPFFTEDQEPPHPMTIENVHGQRLRWNGKRWWDPEASDGSLQTQECWPPYDYGEPVLWREVNE
jgi:hypothetical protein